MQWCGLLVLVAVGMAAPVEEASHNRAKRSEEMLVYGNHQNSNKVKKADPNMSPLEDNTIDEEEEEQRKQDVEKVFAEDDAEAEKSDVAEKVVEETSNGDENRKVVEELFAQDEAPTEEDMFREESSGEEDKDVMPIEEYYYDYFYPGGMKDVGREERSTDGRDKRSAIVAEDMMGGVRSGHGDRRLKRDLNDDLIKDLLDAGSYGGDEYYNYPSFNVIEPEADYQEDYTAEDYPEDYREYLEELMDNAMLEADAAEREEQIERLEEEKAEKEYEEYLEEKQEEEDLEQREEVQKALGLLRIMYENIPDDEEPVVGQRQETGPGYRMEETWEKYLPSGASIDQESVLTDYKPIVYEGQEGIFIPMPQTEKRSVPWGTLSAMPGMKKRGYVGYADYDKRETKRNYDEYERLFRLARALRGNE